MVKSICTITLFEHKTHEIGKDHTATLYKHKTLEIGKEHTATLFEPKTHEIGKDHIALCSTNMKLTFSLPTATTTSLS